GTVTRVADFGIFVQIDGLVEGLMHVSETPLARGEKPQERYKEGDHVRVRILRIDDAEMKIGLSTLNLDESSAPTSAEPAETAAPVAPPPSAPEPEAEASSEAEETAAEEAEAEPAEIEEPEEAPATAPKRAKTSAANKTEAASKKKTTRKKTGETTRTKRKK